MKLIKELAYQCLVLITILGLIFVAADLSSPAAEVFSPLSGLLENADDKSAELAEANVDYFKNVLLPFLIYLIACGGFAFLISENIRLWKSMSPLNSTNKLIFTLWIIILGMMCLLPVYLGTSLINVGLWYVFIVIAILMLFYWAYWASKNN